MIDAADAEMAVDVCEQMTLGRFIDALKSSPQNNTIRFRFASAGVGDFDSYRGYYDHIAIEPTDNVSTVGDVLASATYCLGRALSGYKGGKYAVLWRKRQRQAKRPRSSLRIARLGGCDMRSQAEATMRGEGWGLIRSKRRTGSTRFDACQLHTQWARPLIGSFCLHGRTSRQFSSPLLGQR